MYKPSNSANVQSPYATLDDTAALPFNWGSLQSRVNYLDTKTLVLQAGSAAAANFPGIIGRTYLLTVDAHLF